MKEDYFSLVILKTYDGPSKRVCNCQKHSGRIVVNPEIICELITNRYI